MHAMFEVWVEVISKEMAISIAQQSVSLKSLFIVAKNTGTEHQA